MSEAFIKPEYPLSDITSRIIAAATQVHRSLGPGFEEKVYQRALALEFHAAGLDFSREVWVDVRYRNVIVGKKRVDFMIEGIMIEIKACAELEDVHIIQALSYLKASQSPVGLLLNFGTPRLQIKRLAN